MLELPLQALPCGGRQAGNGVHLIERVEETTRGALQVARSDAWTWRGGAEFLHADHVTCCSHLFQ